MPIPSPGARGSALPALALFIPTAEEKQVETPYETVQDISMGLFKTCREDNLAR